MIDVPYRGSGPYCYANCLVMMLGADAPEAAAVETVTGSPFGLQWVGGSVPFFDPYGWNPDIGIGTALAVLGWTADTANEDDAGAALDRLASSLANGPVMIGPVELGHLRYQPDKTGPIGADHFLVALAMDSEQVTVHDPQGYPYAQLPLADFTAAWRADTLDYGRPYTMRTNFTRRRKVESTDAIAASVPHAISWLTSENGTDMPPGSLGNGDAALALATHVESGCEHEVREHLIHFAVRVGARRLADAAASLRRVGHTAAAAIATEQARLVGSLQHPLVTGDDAAAGDALRALAPTYDELRAALQHQP
ncbi:hypothetical protein [Amycolatopsis magusensis]|uniref:hypothetical protein n=1 Tax=Amycolatopsis magusensis TaxID=882444 RepID=UPI0024A97B5E|nr:hypothetical protein [Amycolatopsis magusensis]MDI5979863.1 hypothetical protein [Amycolatopsis magusensis]